MIKIELNLIIITNNNEMAVMNIRNLQINQLIIYE